MSKPTKSMPNRHNRRVARAPKNLLPIFIDPNFVRVFADYAIVMALGHDVDIAFVATGPKLDTMSSRLSEDSGVTINMTPSFSEVARVRMPPASAAQGAMSIISKMIEQGYINKAELIKSIQEIEEPNVETESVDANPEGVS